MNHKIVGLCLLLPLAACGWRVSEPGREAVLPIPIQPPSQVYLPVSLSTTDVTKVANERIPTELVRQSNIPIDCPAIDCTGQIIVARQAIGLTTSEGKLNTAIPLNAEGRIDFRVKIGPIKVKRAEEARIDARVFTATALGVTEDWKVTSSTSADFTVDRAEWKIGPATISFRGLVSDKIRPHMATLASTIDSKIAGAVDLRTMANTAWPKLFQPYQLSTKYPLWMTLNPRVLAWTPPRSSGDLLTIGVNVESDLMLTFGNAPALRPVPPLPKLMTAPAAPGSFFVALPANIQYAEAANTVMKELGNRWLDVGKDVKVKISRFELKPSGAKLLLGADICADAPTKLFDSCGAVYLWGLPKYDAAARELRVDQLDFDLETKNVLVKAADWLLHTNLQKMIEGKLRFALGDKLDQARAALNEAVDNRTFDNGIIMRGSVTAIEPQGIYVGASEFSAQIQARGTISTTLSPELLPKMN